MTKKKFWNKATLQAVSILVILLAALGGARLMRMLKKPPVRQERPAMIPLLNAYRVFVERIQMIVSGSGTVAPRTEVQVVPQVSGRVIACHPNFVNGGFFQVNESLVQIDPRDFQLAVQQAEAEVASAGVQLQQEQAEADIALNQWKLLHPDEEPTSALVLRHPQIQSAQARLKAAQAQLEKARLNLERTNITMPFAGRVVSSRVDNGQYVVAGQSIGSVYRTDIVEIEVPLENSELEWFDLPGENIHRIGTSEGAGTPANVIADFAGGRYVWQGQVTRTRGLIDSASRMVHVVVEVRNPFSGKDGRPALVPGMFVQIEILGREVDRLVRIPRYALHTGSEVWLEENGHLRIIPVQVVRMDKQFAYITSGLKMGDIVITSPLETVADGMKVRVQMEPDSETGEADADEL